MIQKRIRLFFHKFKILQSVGNDLYKGNIAMKDVLEDQETLVDAINSFNSSAKSGKENKKGEKSLKNHISNKLLCERKQFINAFENGIFPMRYTKFSFSLQRL